MATNKPPGKALKIEIILNSFTSFLIHKETFDIGSLQYIQKNARENRDNFIEGIHNLISRVSDNLIKKRNRETINNDSLVIIILEALLTNILSIEINKKQNLDLFKDFIHKFMSSEFFHDCREMIRCNPSDHLKSFTYVSHLLTQIDYIYRKLKIEEEFEQLVLNISSLKELRDLANPRNIKQISDDLPKEILSKLFTNDLNNIIPLISWNNNNVEIQFSLIRIYLKYFQKTKNYDSLNNINIDGKTMLFNIFRCCVMTFEGNFDNLFSGKLENSKNPLFCFIINYMQMAFLPIYYEFSMIFEQLLLTQNQTEPTPEEFFQNKALGSEMLSFFENLPKQFKNFLCILHEFIKQAKNPNDNAPSSTALRVLLINRFLFNDMLKMMADPDIGKNSSYVKAANYFKDLFYYKNLSGKYLEIPQFSNLCLNYVKVFDQITTDFQGTFNCPSFKISNTMFNYDCELVMRALMEIKINKSELKPQRVQYDFIEYSEPQLIKTVATFQKEEIHKQIMISTNFASAQLKPPKKLTKFRPELHSSTLSTQKNNFYPNNLYIEKSPSNQNQISPYIPLVETNANMQKIVELEKIENEVKQKIEAALELERETQKQNLEKIMERKLLEWEQNHKNNEIQENIKNKDALLNEMYEKINIEEQKFQMLMKIRELDDENSGLKNFLETCPPYYNYYGKDEVEVEEDEDHEYEELNTNNRVEILKNEEEEKKKREKEFYDLCLQSQNILNSMNMEENERVLHMKLNPELW